MVDKPTQKKPTVPEVMPLVREWYDKPGNQTGGIFHVILDDGNYEKVFADQALKSARELGDPEAVILAELLVAMSPTQRRKLSSSI
ncbi:hypothetical protein N0599_21620 [Pseudomonas aeruginosa]|nr:hypothetical protein [Pseudomonas aeruginosa]